LNSFKMTPEEFERICFQSHGQDLAALNYAQDRIIALAKDRDEWKATAMNMNDEKKSLMSKLHQLGLVAEGERANRIMVERRLDKLQKLLASCYGVDFHIKTELKDVSGLPSPKRERAEWVRILIDNGDRDGWMDVLDTVKARDVENQRHLTVPEQEGMHRALRKSVTIVEKDRTEMCFHGYQPAEHCIVCDETE
jgi:hypothetical protein